MCLTKLIDNAWGLMQPLVKSKVIFQQDCVLVKSRAVVEKLRDEVVKKLPCIVHHTQK